MKIDLPAEQKKWLEAEVAAGRFTSIEEAVSIAICDLRLCGEGDLSWLRPYLDTARQQVAAGETIDGGTFIAELNQIISSLRSLEDMSVSERLRLIEELWASLAERPDALGVPQWHREELDARLDAHRSDPSAASDWADAKTSLQRNSRG